MANALKFISESKAHMRCDLLFPTLSLVAIVLMLATAASPQTRADALAELDDVSRDGKWGLVSRLISRGDNNLYLVDLKTRKETLQTRSCS
jgi:hypothetical protein